MGRTLPGPPAGGHAGTGVTTGRRYTARPCASTRSSPRWPAVMPSASTPSTCATDCAHVGIDSDIFYGSFTPDVQHEGRSVTELGRSGRDRWLLYQSSIGSPVYDIFAARPEPKLVNYHNITPAHLLRDWEPNVAYEVALGRTQLARLAPQSRLAVADSAFNESELRALGYEDTAVVPLLIDMQRKSEEADPAARGEAGRTQGGGGRRRPPLRRQGLPAQGAARSGQDVGRAAPALRPGGAPAPGGLAAGGDLRAGAARLHRPSSGSTTRSTSPGRSAEAELEAYLQAADVFVCASDHEGFCVPLAEAMGHGIPIVAYGVTAVPETVGDAGLLLSDKSPLRFAAAVGRVLSDDALRRHLTAAGRARAAGFSLPDSQRRFVSLVQEAIGAPAHARPSRTHQ